MPLVQPSQLVSGHAEGHCGANGHETGSFGGAVQRSLPRGRPGMPVCPEFARMHGAKDWAYIIAFTSLNLLLSLLCNAIFVTLVFLLLRAQSPARRWDGVRVHCSWLRSELEWTVFPIATLMQTGAHRWKSVQSCCVCCPGLVVEQHDLRRHGLCHPSLHSPAHSLCSFKRSWRTACT